MAFGRKSHCTTFKNLLIHLWVELLALVCIGQLDNSYISNVSDWQQLWLLGSGTPIVAHSKFSAARLINVFTARGILHLDFKSQTAQMGFYSRNFIYGIYLRKHIDFSNPFYNPDMELLHEASYSSLQHLVYTFNTIPNRLKRIQLNILIQ